MRTKELTPEPTQDASLSYIPDWNNGKTFTINSDYEDVLAVKEQVDALVPQAPVSHVEAPQPVASPEPAHVNLAELSGRQIARLSLRALRHDVLTLGRTSLYRQFKEKVHEEQDLQAMVDLHIVESVRCAKHERQLAKVRGII